jgi:hypothetical protein
LTPEEYAHVTLAKRKMEAENKYRARIQAAKERQEAIRNQGTNFGKTGGAAGGAAATATSGGGAGGDFAYQHASMLREGEYQDPAPNNSYFYRSP